MKQIFIALMTLGVAFATQADPGQGSHRLSVQGNRSARLSYCGGTAQLNEGWLGGLTLRFDDVRDCSVIALNGRAVDTLSNVGSGGNGSATLSLPRGSRWTVDLYSKSRKTSEHFEIVNANNPQPPTKANVVLDSFWHTSDYLPECGGSAELKVTNGQANLIFRNLENCSNFDIIGNNGESLNYENKKIGTEQNRSGSFTLPRRFLDFGLNGVLVVVKSNSGAHADTILLKFIAL